MKVPTVQGLPILLPSHYHPEFGDPAPHYHINWLYLEGTVDQAKVVFSDEPVQMVEHKRVRRTYEAIIKWPNILDFLTTKYLGQAAKCGRCPHKGMPIFNNVCSGHGLVFKDKKVVQVTVTLNCSRDKMVMGTNLPKFEFHIHDTCSSPALTISDGEGFEKTVPIDFTLFRGDTLVFPKIREVK